MSDHTITVEITVKGDTRQAAQTSLAETLNWMDHLSEGEAYERWSFASHERIDFPALTAQYADMDLTNADFGI